jgi:translation elongation factor EF-Ts
MSYTPDQLKKIQNLRRELNAGMTTCSKVLAEANWDEEKAKELMVREFEKIAEKKKDNPIKHSFLFIDVKQDYINWLILGCETDFSLNNEKFYECGDYLVKNLDNGVENLRNPLLLCLGALGENIQIVKYGKVDVNGYTYHYLHNPLHGNRGTALSVVEFSNDFCVEMKEVAIRIAQHICVFPPKTLDELKEQSFLFNEKIKVIDVLNHSKLKEYIEHLIQLNYDSLEDMKKDERKKEFSYADGFVSQIMQHISVFKPKTLSEFMNQPCIINSSVTPNDLLKEININKFYFNSVQEV